MEISRSVSVAAPVERVWQLISDLPGMGEFSPENTGGAWRGGATGPAVGARFRGSNRNGRRRWSTSVQVVRCEPGKAFAFAVSAAGLPISEWSFELASEGGAGCTLTETWADRRPGWSKRGGTFLSGVKDRADFTAGSIEATLAAVKEKAERS